MRLQLVSLILLRLFVVVDVKNHRMLISSKQTILMTAEEDGPAAVAASLNASIHSKMSHHHQPTATLQRVLHRQGAFHYGGHLEPVPSDKGSSMLREKRASQRFAEEGMQVSPVLTLTVTDTFNKPLTGSQGPTELRVGDAVRFIITLTRDGIYNSLEVTRCIMSTSQTMPDPTAETRVLLIKGCPIQDEVTADSWYWTSEKSTSAAFISNTQAVPIFRLATSEYIYLHCSMKMCFTGSAPCQQPTRDDCIVFQRKKREDFLPTRRRRSVTDGVTDVNQTLALRVIDPKLTPTSNNPFEVGTSGFIALIVLVSLIGFVVIILIIILVVILFDRRPKRSRRTHPQQFAEQRVTPTTTTATNRRCLACRCLTCC